ncbi:MULTISPECIES: glycerophosphoryl diester phosphodiesterase membrane domain-containing protein [Streptococcus]|uniref:Glycerophosphodiester phosphodiesterase n=1 Tax=Streptococcus oralis TaxID=1303 RepID=A0A7T2ZM70_STROR|nr:MULTISPECIES: glycerophosphodiester phosphodiesterase [Streptococcus]MCY7090778.1 glycerophosphodiester phosphodiesterase [Streptococcus oralis]ORO81589.1 glycerophosphodiester phosphodiesterase [Streptococcus oralis subsp. dentisani]ORO82132.1 glycerophosphodiester phosphodiesterase [Streptococcus oralis subsp. dentisani]QPS96611.1 glycerophosphodiester phosphodiesterase [Streptococcus oralis]
MKPEKPKKLGFRKIYLNLDKVLFLFFLIFMMVEYLWLPLNSFLAGLLLSQTGYLFISYNNIFAIITSSPLISLAFLFLIAINLLVAYFQICLLFIGARHLLYHEKRTLIEYSRKVFQQSFLFMKRLSFCKMAFVFFYVAMLFPFIRKILKIYYLNKIVIPDFIVTYLEDKHWLVGLMIFASAWILLYVSVRLMFALPKILFEKRTVREGVKYSLQKTKKQVLFYAWNLLLIIIKTYLFFFLLLTPLLIGQIVIDNLTQKESLILGVINFVLIKNIHYMALTYFLVKFVSFLTGEELEIMPRRKKDHLMRWGVMGCASIFFALEGYIYLEAPVTNTPLVISHRGVSNKNGVQNTVQSLEKTAQLKPDLIEMDVQETKDGQFVMMHDANLKNLAGINARPQDLTLEELTGLDIFENGYRTKISSFDDYLNRANELHQRLLIEIKTSKKDSPQMMERFLEKYGPIIKQYGHQMQSLDYHVIDQVLKYDSTIPAYFILPYNSIFPKTKATGYTMEYSTLDEYFVTKLWYTEQKLYVWTINSSDALDKSLQLSVDGMITDDMEMLQETLAAAQEDPEYTDLLLKKATEFFNF